MKKIFVLASVLAGIAATPALADRPFGSSNQGPPVVTQTATPCPMHHGSRCPMRHGGR
jgi:hypothetical protein